MKTFTTILGSLAVMLAGTFGLAGTTALAQEHTHEDHATTEGQQA